MHQTLLMSREYNCEQNKWSPCPQGPYILVKAQLQSHEEVLQVSCHLDYMTEILLTKFVSQEI